MNSFQPNNGSFIDHLEELRKRIIYVILWFSLSCILMYLFNNEILKFTLRPLLKLQEKPLFISPVEPFVSIIKIVLFSGLILSIPCILYQFYIFVKPALTKKQSKIFSICLVSGAILFYSGICLSYFFIIPFGLKILFGFSKNLMIPGVTISYYLSFFIWMSLIIGIIFQMPVIMFFLGISEFVEITWFRKMRRFVYAGTFIITAIITPTTDAITMLILSVVLISLYEITLFILKLLVKSK